MGILGAVVLQTTEGREVSAGSARRNFFFFFCVGKLPTEAASASQTALTGRRTTVLLLVECFWSGAGYARHADDGFTRCRDSRGHWYSGARGENLGLPED
jgi:hypothetical protein